MKALTQRVLIMAGGTGGHVFPALAVAQALRAEGVAVSWLGTRQGLEAELVPRAGFPIDFISVQGLRGKGALGWLLAPLRLSLALMQALAVCFRRRPHTVLGLGGFVTGPGGVASWLLRRPLVIHEQNAIPGLTNRLLSHLATRVLEAFPGTFVHATHTGNPVRNEISSLAEPDARFAEHSGQLRLLVIGGSLGAQALNERIPAALAALPENLRPAVRHQSGSQKLQQTQEAYITHGVSAQVDAFIDDMAAAYAWADLVICRAGALTVSELAAAGLGAILVPYPYAVDDHQTQNAAYLAEAQAALLIPQSKLSVERLSACLTELLGTGRERLLDMARAARALARPQATREVVTICLEVAHG